jgi:hypothetical protein
MLVETLVPQSLPAREAVPLVTNLELLRAPAIAYRSRRRGSTRRFSGTATWKGLMSFPCTLMSVSACAPDSGAADYAATTMRRNPPH